MASYKRFRSLARFFKKELPCTHPVKIKRVNMPKRLDGDCQFINEDFFLVRVEKDVPEYFALEILTHEFSHALSWTKTGDPHGPKWGLAYSLVYRAFLRWHAELIGSC